MQLVPCDTLFFWRFFFRALGGGENLAGAGGVPCKGPCARLRRAGQGARDGGRPPRAVRKNTCVYVLVRSGGLVLIRSVLTTRVGSMERFYLHRCCRRRERFGTLGQSMKGPRLTYRVVKRFRAWEILESRHGRANPDVGAACISLGNLAIIRRRQDEAIDWFRRALGTFEVRS